jgi:pimeloyl-ACP methyl ester carboxylesterase
MDLPTPRLSWDVRRRLTAIGLGLVAIMVATAAPTMVKAEDGGQVVCNKYTQASTVPASLVPNGKALPYSIVGELCATPSELRDGTTVQLLVHGATYNHTYWDLPGVINGVRYSYARDVAAAGIPTFAIDQLGTVDDFVNGGGQSAPPSSDQLTVDVSAFVVHQALQGLKGTSNAPVISGNPRVPHFGNVIVVGHSFGSFTTWQESITYHDAAGVIVTGAVHHLIVPSSPFPPASQDPKFASLNLDAGYISLMGAFRNAFYNTSDADPAAIASDDANRDVFPAAGETPESLALTSPSSTATKAIKVPVLVVMGTQDAVFCDKSFNCSTAAAIAQQEAPHYSAQAELQACVVPNSGHSISFHRPPAPNQQEADAVAWSHHFVGLGEDDQGQNQNAGSQDQRWTDSPNCTHN